MLQEMPFEIENYNLIEEDPKKKKQEFAFYLKKLKRLGLVKYEEKEAFTKAGRCSTKYNNNVTIICEDKILNYCRNNNDCWHWILGYAYWNYSNLFS